MGKEIELSKEEFSKGLEYVIGGLNFLSKAINGDPLAMEEPSVSRLLEKTDPKIRNIICTSYSKFVDEYHKKDDKNVSGQNNISAQNYEKTSKGD